MQETLGILAGLGTLPTACAQAAKARNMRVVVVSLLPETDENLPNVADAWKQISITDLEAIFAFLKAESVQKVTMIGKVTKELLFTGNARPKPRLMQMLASLPDQSDDTIMQGFVRELLSEGMQPLDQTLLLQTLMPKAGVLTKRAPTDVEKKDMEFALKMAKEIGRLDVGQTAVVKNLAVMALEAIEGTDACILRGGKLAGTGAVVGKAAKPQQDLRFDVPTVGASTIAAMIKVQASALAIEAGKTLLAEREKTLALAEANGIAIVAM